MKSAVVSHSADAEGDVSAVHMLRTGDGVTVRVESFRRASATGDPGPDDLVFVVVPGFTQSSRAPRVRRIIGWLRAHGGVVQVDLRGHGGSGGASTVGDDEVHDVEAAVAHARSLGYRRVVTVGFSLGAAVVLRHAALHGDVAAVAAVSGPGQWFYRGTAPMRTLHRAVGTRPGRAVLRVARGTRVLARAWAEPYPLDPSEAAARIAVPVLIVHGDRDDYFPLHHAWRIHRAGGSSTLWVESGFGHAENHMTADLTARIAGWLDEASAEGGAPAVDAEDVRDVDVAADGEAAEGAGS